MKRIVLIILFLSGVISANSAVRFPLNNEDHVRRAKTNRGLAIGSAAVGAGWLMGTATYHVVKNAFWNDQAARWKMQYQSELISKSEFDRQMSLVENGRDGLRNVTRRNYFIAGGLFVASIGFGLNARRHKLKITEETSFTITPAGFQLTYVF